MFVLTRVQIPWSCPNTHHCIELPRGLSGVPTLNLRKRFDPNLGRERELCLWPYQIYHDLRYVILREIKREGGHVQSENARESMSWILSAVSCTL